MKPRFAFAIASALLLATAAWAQDNPAPLETQNPPAQVAPGPGPMGMGPMGRGMGPMGRGVAGTVTAMAADQLTIKTFRGPTYTIRYSANTRFIKQPAGPMGRGRAGAGAGYGMRRNPPQPIQASDIKAGDAVTAMGEIDPSTQSVGAIAVVLLDPQRAKMMEQMEADYGKTWLMGKVTAIEGSKVTLQDALDNAPNSFVANENTSFRQRRQPLTLADIKPGALVRVEGALKDGVFTATIVHLVPPAGQMRGMRGGYPPQ